MAHDPFGTDLRLVFARGSEGADLAAGLQDLETVEGLENLVQALTLRLLVDRGELAVQLSAPAYFFIERNGKKYGFATLGTALGQLPSYLTYRAPQP